MIVGRLTEKLRHLTKGFTTGVTFLLPIHGACKLFTKGGVDLHKEIVCEKIEETNDKT